MSNTTIELKLSRSNRVYRPGESIQGKIVATLTAQISYHKILITTTGTVNLQSRGGVTGVIDSLYGVVKPIRILKRSFEVASPSGKLGPGRTEIPFSFILSPPENETLAMLYETFHGGNISIQYLITADVLRGYLQKSLSATLEFIVENDRANPSCHLPEYVHFYITQDTQKHQLLPELLTGHFKVTGKILTQCSLKDPITGDLTVEASVVPINSIDIQLLRVESILAGEKFITETSEIQTTQVSIIISFQSQLSKLYPKSDLRAPRPWEFGVGNDSVHHEIDSINELGLVVVEVEHRLRHVLHLQPHSFRLAIFFTSSAISTTLSATGVLYNASSVAIANGDTQLTRTPCRPSFAAALRISPARCCDFAASNHARRRGLSTISPAMCDSGRLDRHQGNGRRHGRPPLTAGYAVAVYTRTPSKPEPLRLLGAQLAQSPADAARSADVVFTMVGHPSDVRQVLLHPATGALTALPSGGVIVDCTSSDPALAREIASAARAKGCWAVAVPMSGGDIGAREGKLAILAGGNEGVVQWLSPLFEVLGRATWMGPVGSGQSSKIANQIAIGGTLVGLSEAMMFAERAGLDVLRFLEAVRGGAARSRAMEIFGERIAKRDFCAGWLG